MSPWVLPERTLGTVRQYPGRHRPYQPYFDYRDTLGYENGLILKAERVVIPKVLRPDMMRCLHAAHLGYESMLRRARESIFWPGMPREIKQLADNCSSCQESKPANCKEALRQHEAGTVPWEKIGCDLFEINGHNYLVVIDYFSNFIEVDLLTTSSRVVSAIKKMCACFGIPRQVVSDRGPQFTSSELERFVE